MSDKSLIEEIQEAELKGASAEDKFAAKLASCSDQDFDRIKSYLCSLGDKEKQRAASTPMPPRELSDEEAELAKLDDAQFEDELLRLGVNLGTKFETDLSSAMKRERKRRADGGT